MANPELDYEICTRSNRETKLVNFTARCSINSPLLEKIYASLQPESEKSEDSNLPLWEISLDYLTGLDVKKKQVILLRTEENLEQIEQKMRNSFSETSLSPNSGFFSEFNEEARFDAISSIDPDSMSPICYEILRISGVINRRYKPTKNVLYFLNKPDRLRMKNSFGDNWSLAAQVNFCLNKFPPTSLATLASQAFYHMFITCDDFSCGYIYREIQLILGGAERIAIEAQAIRSKAGQYGAQKSQSARDLRVQMFWEEIEKLAHHFPSFTVEMIETQAFKKAIARDEKLWSEGKGAMDKYLTDFIRSKEPYKSRYYGHFGNTA